MPVAPLPPFNAPAFPSGRVGRVGRVSATRGSTEAGAARAAGGTHSTARIAKAAGLSEMKLPPRLRALEAAGEVHRVGTQRSTERRSTDLEATFDRLEARIGNLRIIRPRERVG